MKLLLDTHIVLWALADDGRLSPEARKLILDPDNTIYYSVISTWEVSIKHTLHPDNVDVSGLEFSVFCDEAGFIPLDLRERHVMALEDLDEPGMPPIHNDPFDRMLLSQAKAEHMKLLTHDKNIQRYNEKCILGV